MFIKAYASGSRGQAGPQRNINRMLGIGGGRDAQSRHYRRVGTSGMGGNRRTRGRQATITPVRGR